MIAKIKVFVCRRGEVGSFQSLDYLVLAVLTEFLSFLLGENTSNLANIKNYIVQFFQKKVTLLNFYFNLCLKVFFKTFKISTRDYIDVSKILNDKYFRTQILFITKNSKYFIFNFPYICCTSKFCHHQQNSIFASNHEKDAYEFKVN